MTIRRILCPTDFSTPSRAALDYAVKLAKEVGAAVRVLHTYSLPTYYALPEVALIPSQDYALHCSTAGQAKLDELLSHYGDAGVPIEAGLVVGPAAGEIVQDAKNHQADLIVMASRGHGAVAKLLLGSVTERVLRLAPCPVVVVPPAVSESAE